MSAVLQPSEEMLSVADVARELGCSMYIAPEKVRQMAYVKGSRGRLLVSRSDFEQWRQQRDEERAARIAKVSRRVAGNAAARARRLNPVVYFIEDADGHIKIGRATDISVRFSMIQNAHARPVKLLGTIPGGRSEERALHMRFAALHIRGEWFHGAGPLVAYIRGLP